MKAKLKSWQGTTQQILIGLVFATLIVAVIEANSDYDEDCGWSFLGDTVSHYGSGDRHKIRIGRGRCRLEAEFRGEIDVASDNREVTRVGPGAEISIKQRLQSERRRLDVTRGAGGRPEYKWFVNRLPEEFDDEARIWLAEVLPRIYRSSGFDADGRVEQLWNQGGLDAVFDEIEKLGSDYVRGTYLREVLRRTSNDDELVRAVSFGRREISHDHELARVLGVLTPAKLKSQPVREAWATALRSIDSDSRLRRTLSSVLDQGELDAELLEALLSAARTINSDFEQGHLLREVVEKLPADQALPRTYFDALRSIGTDHEHKRTLTTALARPGLTEDEADALLETARRISNDFELANLLDGFAADYPRDRRLPESFFEALRKVESDAAMRQALTAVVERRDLDAATAAKLLDVARSVSSDHELRTILVQLVDRYPAGQDLPQEFEHLMKSVDSEFERERIEGALRRHARARRAAPVEAPPVEAPPVEAPPVAAEEPRDEQDVEPTGPPEDDPPVPRGEG